MTVSFEQEKTYDLGKGNQYKGVKLKTSGV